MKNCINYKGTISDGYGVKTINGKKYRVHRLIYELFNNTVIPKDKVIMHKCDNRRCINPEHLELGTLATSCHDRHKKGRDAKGENNGKSILTEQIV